MKKNRALFLLIAAGVVPAARIGTAEEKKLNLPKIERGGGKRHHFRTNGYWPLPAFIKRPDR